MESKAITVARWVSLLAAFVWGAVAEYKLATAVGADRYTAALLPLVLDVYGFAAMRAARTSHVAGALVAMFGTQMVSHLLTLGNTGALHVFLSIMVSTIPPAVSLACHRLKAVPAVDTPEVTPRVVETTTAREGFRADYAIVDEIQEWDRIVDAVKSPVSDRVYVADDTPAETVDAETEPVDTPDDTPKPRTPEELAAQGHALVAAGMSKTDAAVRLGVSRQWLHSRMKRFPLVDA